MESGFGIFIKSQIKEEGSMDMTEQNQNKKEASITEEDIKVRPDRIKIPERRWYVIHTYTGYEDQVAIALRQRIETLHMQDKIFNVMVPTEKQIEMKGGKKKVVERKIFPGYVFVEMIISERSWYVVRNTPNVTGFIGFGTIPTPISEEEIKRIKKRMHIEEPKYRIDFKKGDTVKIIDGPFKDTDGTVEEVNEERGKIKVLISIFGREAPVELDFLQVKKI
jgi:transcriptional antiterminator NusG